MFLNSNIRTYTAFTGEQQSGGYAGFDPDSVEDLDYPHFTNEDQKVTSKNM